MQPLSTVVVLIDLPSSGLKRDDVGAVVGVYEPDGLEVVAVKEIWNESYS